MAARRIVLQGIAGFGQDEEGHWVAELACGHRQHVRHDPPWQIRPWVQTAEGRAAMRGYRLECPQCDAVAAAVQSDDRETET